MHPCRLSACLFHSLKLSALQQVIACSWSRMCLLDSQGYLLMCRCGLQSRQPGLAARADAMHLLLHLPFVGSCGTRQLSPISAYLTVPCCAACTGM